MEMRVLELFVKLGAASPQALQQVRGGGRERKDPFGLGSKTEKGDYLFVQKVAATKAIKPLLDNLNSPREDVLWNLNALELLKRVRTRPLPRYLCSPFRNAVYFPFQLLVTAHGFDYLATFNILEYLAGFVGQLASGQVDPMTASVLAVRRPRQLLPCAVWNQM